MQAFLFLLSLLLIGLKLAGVIFVSWWVATAPLWGPIIIDLTVLVFIVIYTWAVTPAHRNRKATR